MIATLPKWIEEADAYMLMHCCITMTTDAGISQEELEIAMSQGLSPKAYCELLAEKYDLSSRSQMRADWGLAE